MGPYLLFAMGMKLGVSF